MAWVRFVKPPAGEIWVYSCLNPQCIYIYIIYILYIYIYYIYSIYIYNILYIYIDITRKEAKRRSLFSLPFSSPGCAAML